MRPLHAPVPTLLRAYHAPSRAGCRHRIEMRTRRDEEKLWGRTESERNLGPASRWTTPRPAMTLLEHESGFGGGRG